jgi:hypothetical protein
MPVEDFNELLGKLREHDRDQIDPNESTYRVSHNVADAMLSLAASRPLVGARAVAYYEGELNLPPSPQPPSLADLKRQIAGAGSVSDLRRLRRSFARWSHPDRRSEADDAYANFQMAAANELIDKAILALRGQARRTP